VTETSWHPDAAEPAKAAIDAIRALEAAGFKAALGGSLALGIWGVPRGTGDADLNVFTGEARYPDLVLCLEQAGFAPMVDRSTWDDGDRRRLVARMRDGDYAAFFRGPIRLDVFVPSFEFYDEAERTLRSFRAEGRDALALSPEALAVFKMLFFRDKDIVDLRRLVAVQGAALDHRWVRDHLAAMFPNGDERLDTWDAIVRDHGPGAVP
jgi:hypothetical protein